MSTVTQFLNDYTKHEHNTAWISRELLSVMNTPVSIRTAHQTLYRVFPFRFEAVNGASEDLSKVQVWTRRKIWGKNGFGEIVDVVSFASIIDSFQIHVSYPPRHAIEIKNTLIPIQPFQVVESAKDEIVLFVSIEDLARTVRAQVQSAVRLTIYGISSDYVHCFQKLTQADTQKQIIENLNAYRNQKQAVAVPSALTIRDIHLPACRTYDEALDALRGACMRDSKSRPKTHIIDTETDLDIFQFMKGI